MALEWGGKKEHCQAKPQFVGCDCAIHLCNHPFLKVALSLLAKEFEAEPVYMYDILFNKTIKFQLNQNLNWNEIKWDKQKII